jgi:hypothetical protein
MPEPDLPEPDSYVRVSCVGSQVGPHDLSKLATFQRELGREWTMGASNRELLGRTTPAQVTYEESEGEYRRYEALPGIGSSLDGLTPRWDGLTESIIGKRIHMRCHMCGLSYTRRGEELSKILGRLADAGLTEITLAALMRR